MIVVTLLEPGPAALRTAIDELDDVADAFEIRLDALAEPVPPSELRRLTTKSLIAACRRSDDGGMWRGREDTRLALLASCIQAGFDYADIEHDASLHVPEERLIRSRHDFETTPEADALTQELRTRAAGGAVVKFASRVTDFGDALTLLAVARRLKDDSTRHAVMGLGDFPRALLPLFGAHFVYGGGRRNAPGQPGARDLVSMMDHWGRPGPSEDLFLVVGSPVAHSLSPRIHNAAFRAHGVDASFGALDVPGARELQRLVRAAIGIRLRGLSVTAPLKEAAFRLADERTPEAEAAGAANTLRIGPDGHVLGHNTDGLGTRDVMASRFRHLGPNARILLIGAGGAARGILAALPEHAVTVCARRAAARHAIDETFHRPAVSPDEAVGRLAEFDLLINATTAEDPLPLGGYRGALFDLHYNALPTTWQTHATSRGARFAGGLDLLVAQARHAWSVWMRTMPDERAMREAVEVTA